MTRATKYRSKTNRPQKQKKSYKKICHLESTDDFYAPTYGASRKHKDSDYQEDSEVITHAPPTRRTDDIDKKIQALKRVLNKQK
jgi:hypothetical protein